MIPGLERYQHLFDEEILADGVNCVFPQCYDQTLHEILAEPFTIEDVCRVIYVEDEPEEGEMIVVELYDGRFIRICYSQDYTFDNWSVDGAITEEDMIRYGMTEGERKRAGFLLKDIDIP